MDSGGRPSWSETTGDRPDQAGQPLQDQEADQHCPTALERQAGGAARYHPTAALLSPTEL